MESVASGRWSVAGRKGKESLAAFGEPMQRVDAALGKEGGTPVPDCAGREAARAWLPATGGLEAFGSLLGGRGVTVQVVRREGYGHQYERVAGGVVTSGAAEAWPIVHGYRSSPQAARDSSGDGPSLCDRAGW